ncbi:MAG: IclR family transcriptional regulator, partial [Janthinobacterium lividum]
CFALGALYQRSLRLGDILLPLMRELAQLSGESAAFYVRDRDLRVCLHRVDSQHAIRFHVREGDVLPLGSGSGGLTLLAFAGEPGARYARIRAAGYCVSVGERDRDTAGISAPVFGVRQALRGVLTLAGPSSRVDRAFIDRVLPEFLSIAARSSEALGGDAEQLRDAMQQR